MATAQRRASQRSRSSGGGRSSSVGAEIPVVTVKVPRFLKHPSGGHTVYDCRVELTETKQLWAVFRRYREFVNLRQHLKTVCQQHRQLQRARSSGRGSNSHTPTKRGSNRGAATVVFSAAGGVGGGGGGGGTDSRGRASGSTARTVRSIEAILSECRFPSKIALGRSFSLRQERRKALHAFLAALVQLRPLPQVVADFLGLLENNRLAIDHNGNYVRVMRVEKVLPMPASPGFQASRARAKKKLVATGTGAASARRNGDAAGAGASPASPSSSAGAVAAAGRAVGPSKEGDGGPEKCEGKNADGKGNKAKAEAQEEEEGPRVGTVEGGDRAVPLVETEGFAVGGGSSAEAVRGGARGRQGNHQHRPQQQSRRRPSVGSSAWAGVRAVEMAGSSGEGTQEAWDTEGPTDSESGSDSESEFEDIKNSNDNNDSESQPGMRDTGTDGTGIGISPLPSSLSQLRQYGQHRSPTGGDGRLARDDSDAGADVSDAAAASAVAAAASAATAAATAAAAAEEATAAAAAAAAIIAPFAAAAALVATPAAPTPAVDGSVEKCGNGGGGVVANSEGADEPRPPSAAAPESLKGRALPPDVAAAPLAKAGRAAAAAATASSSVPSSPYAPLSKLRGGGANGGGGSDGDEEEEEEEGWEMVVEAAGEMVSGEGRRKVGGVVAVGGGERETQNEREEAGWEEDHEERMIQWEFLNGYLEEVVVKVVGRRGLLGGLGSGAGTGTALGGGGSGGGGGLSSLLPLSEEERDVRAAELMSFGVNLPYDMLLTLLRYKDWGPEAATALYQDLVAAGKGLLERVTPGAAVRGIENGGNTCYIDSLLFAMFATLDAFDWLLVKPLPATDPPEVKLLQKHLRFLVNQLRRGATVPREHSNLVRTHLRTCGWQGGPSTQEDVTELFTFLVCLLRCPALPLSEALFHGGNVEAGDSRISTERALFLALPEEDKDLEPKRAKSVSPRGAKSTALFASTAAAGATASASTTTPSASTSSPQRQRQQQSGWGATAASTSKGEGGSPSSTAAAAAATARDKDKERSGGTSVSLEQILMHNFHDNRVEGLRRSVSGEKGSQPVDAWRMVSMLPFYALSGEHAGDSDPSNDKHFDTIMLPMVLKRYEADIPPSHAAASASPRTRTAAVAKKSRRRVVVPHKLDVSNFMAPSAGAKDHGGRFVLVLRSAVCHLGGESVNKGHYVAYTADRVAAADGNGSTDARGTGGPSRQGGGVGIGKSVQSGTGGVFDWQQQAVVGGGGMTKTKGKPGVGSCQSQDSVAWLRLDDLREVPGGGGFVERLDSVHDANRLFSEDLGLHSYMLFYELVPLNLDDAGKAKMKEKLALIETQSDYQLALQLDLIERAADDAGDWSRIDGSGRGAAGVVHICPVS